jgi:hypothetical protein
MASFRKKDFQGGPSNFLGMASLWYVLSKIAQYDLHPQAMKYPKLLLDRGPLGRNYFS